MKTIHIVGARPQFIKMAAVSRAVAKYNQEHGSDKLIQELIVHTGQHYDYELSKIVFDELHIPKPDYNLGVGSANHGEQTGEMLKRVEQVLLKERPDVVLVYGDTNSTLAGALTAAKLHIPVTHVEAGLRSFNRRMPEEINRVLADHVSTILFCPTETAVRNLKREGFSNIEQDGSLVPIEASKIGLKCSPDNPLVINVGDVMFDSVLYNLKLAEQRSTILDQLHLKPNEPNGLNKPNEPNELMDYALATVHRAENADDPARVKAIFKALSEIAAKVPVVTPLHPRTRKALHRSFSDHELRTMNSRLTIIKPVSYLDMLLLEKNAKLILTDSGGVQKEAFVLKLPCITLREETEWVETVEAGWNVLVGANKDNILRAVEHFNSRKRAEPQVGLYGDGRASQRIAEVIVSLKR